MAYFGADWKEAEEFRASLEASTKSAAKSLATWPEWALKQSGLEAFVDRKLAEDGEIRITFLHGSHSTVSLPEPEATFLVDIGFARFVD